MSLAIGVDIGGTFTDFVMLDAESGRWYFTKVHTTPADQSLACVEGMQALLAQAKRTADTVAYVGHGSTVATNVLIERNGAKTALITTKGVRDVLEIRRQVMPHRYDVRVPKPEPLVPRPLRMEVTERVLSDGSVERELDESELEHLLKRLEAQGVESIAISFLHAYANPVNEDRAYTLASKFSDWYVCTSHEVLNEFREYERTSTTVANAYVAPAMQRYLDRLANRFHDEIGVQAPVLVFQSNGGVVPTSQAGTLSIASLMSGPAAGAMAACAVARQTGIDDFISLDMGGTSCDVALVKGGTPTRAYAQEVAGWAVRTPRLDVHTVGAGGGSIAWTDQGGLLRVGPQSAGADPGPACYGHGGTDATVTDANVVLGRLNPEYLLGGRMALWPEHAANAVSNVGVEVGLDLDEAASGILDVVNSTMVRAIRVVSVERGYDPRDFALVAFGGAGPLHACDLAREMGIATVIVPPHPGVLSALGLLVSDLRIDGSLTRRFKLSDVTPQTLHESFATVETRLRDSAAVRSQPDAPWRAKLSLDMRYMGQSFELQVPVTQEMFENNSLQTLSDAFDIEHERRYGFAASQREKEIMGLRVLLEAPAGIQARDIPSFQADGEGAPSVRRVFFKETGWMEDCPVYQRTSLMLHDRLEGPAVIEQMDSTILIPPGFHAKVDDHTNVILTNREI